jgi:hypothetical protein
MEQEKKQPFNLRGTSLSIKAKPSQAKPIDERVKEFAKESQETMQSTA